MRGLVLIHAGAGYHSVSKEQAYKSLCDAACRKGVDELLRGSEAAEAAVEVMKILEDSPLTNAGHGSSLSIDGEVECDASLMTADGYFGAVAAVTGVRNPITVAERLVQLQHSPPADGRIPPSCLAGDGAARFAAEQGLVLVDPSTMISGAAQNSFEKYRKIVEKHKPGKRPLDDAGEDSTHQSKRPHSSVNGGAGLLDTVGVICLDQSGSLASALSSGGIALKHSGRVGQAAMIGSGCWVDKTIAVATTGCGEQLMRTLLAKTIADCLSCPSSEPDDVPAVSKLDNAMKNSFIDSSVLVKDSLKLAGAIVVQLDQSNAELLWTHSTKSMCVSYMTTAEEGPTTLISRLGADKVSQQCVSGGLTMQMGDRVVAS